MNYLSKNKGYFLKNTSFFWTFSEKQIKIEIKKVPSGQLRHDLVNKNHKKQSKFTAKIPDMQINLYYSISKSLILTLLGSKFNEYSTGKYFLPLIINALYELNSAEITLLFAGVVIFR